MQNLSVEIIIPTYKPTKQLIKLLDKLAGQTWPIQKIRIINTEEKYFMKDDLSEYSNLSITHIEQKDFDHGGTRDQAARLSNADILMFFTQDAMPANEETVENLIGYFEDSTIGAVYARQLPKADCKEIEKYTRAFNYPPCSMIKSLKDIDELGIKTFFCSNVCAAYRKEAYDSLGGFTKHTIFNEDMIMAGKMIKAGLKIAYAAEAEVIHSHNYSNWQQFTRNFDIAVSQVTHPEIFDGLKSEGEGVRLVLQTIKHCIRIKKPWLIAELIVKSGFKFLGYKMGQRYASLPKWLVYRCTMNRSYWDKETFI